MKIFFLHLAKTTLPLIDMGLNFSLLPVVFLFSPFPMQIMIIIYTFLIHANF